MGLDLKTMPAHLAYYHEGDLLIETLVVKDWVSVMNRHHPKDLILWFYSPEREDIVVYIFTTDLDLPMGFSLKAPYFPEREEEEVDLFTENPELSTVKYIIYH